MGTLSSDGVTKEEPLTLVWMLELLSTTMPHSRSELNSAASLRDVRMNPMWDAAEVVGWLWKAHPYFGCCCHKCLLYHEYELPTHVAIQCALSPKAAQVQAGEEGWRIL